MKSPQLLVAVPVHALPLCTCYFAPSLEFLHLCYSALYLKHPHPTLLPHCWVHEW